MFRSESDSCTNFKIPVLLNFILFFMLSMAAGNIYAQTGNLEVKFKSVSISDTTVLRGKQAGFPNPVMSIITVRDKKGRYVHGLADTSKWLTAMDIAENGEKVDYIWKTLLEYHKENTSLPDNKNIKTMIPEYMVTEVPRIKGYGASIALAMDCSGSINNLDVIEDAAKNFVRSMSNEDQAAVIKITDYIMVYQTFTSDTTLLINAISKPTPDRSGTALYQGIYKALEECSGQQGRKVVIVYTDGLDDKGVVTLDEIIQYANNYDIAIYSIGIGSGTDIDEVSLQKMAYSTGGTYTKANRTNDISKIYMSIYRDIQGYYILATTTTDRRTNGTWRIVDVSVKDKDGNEGRGQGEYYVPFTPRNVKITKKAVTENFIVDQGDTLLFTSAGDTISYEITVINKGPGVAENVKITDQLSDSLKYIKFTVQPDKTEGKTANWDIGLLNPGQSVKIGYTAKVNDIMPQEKVVLINRAEVFTDYDSDPSDNTAQVKVYSAGSPDLTVRCINPGFVLSPMYPFTLSAYVYNNGNANAENPFTVNFFIGDYSNVAAVDTVKSLAVGDSVLVAGLWKYPASGTFNIQVYADFPDKVTELSETNNTDTCSVKVGITLVNLVIDNISYVISYNGLNGSFPEHIITKAKVFDQNNNYITNLAGRTSWLNLSGIADNSLKVSDIWYKLKEYHKGDPSNPQQNDVRGSLQITEVDTSQSIGSRYYLISHSSSDTIQNKTWRTVELGVDINGIKDTDTGDYLSPDGPADLALVQHIMTKQYKVSGNDTTFFVQPRDTVKFKIFIKNVGHKNVSVSTVTNYLPAFAKVISSEPLVSNTQGDAVKWNIGFMAVGSSKKIEFTCLVDTLKLSGPAVYKDIAVLASIQDTIYTNNRDSSYITYLPLQGGDLAVTKNAVSDSMAITGTDTLNLSGPGKTIVYTVKVVNKGQLDCEDIKFTDTIPDRLTLKTFTGASFTYSGDTLKWNLSKLGPNGASKEFTYKCIVDSLMPPWDIMQVNTVWAYSISDTLPNNNFAKDSVLCVGPAVPDPEIKATPSAIAPLDSVKIEVMSPIDAVWWDLTVMYDDGSQNTVYADQFISATDLKAHVWRTVNPDLTDTRMRTTATEENIIITLHTRDMWNVEYSASASVLVKSSNQFYLDENKLIPDQKPELGIRFRLSSNRRAEIKIYDISGAYIATVYDAPAFAGWNHTVWDGKDSAGRSAGSGLYIAVLNSGNYQKARKFILIR